jgi:hypothetical protein
MKQAAVDWLSAEYRAFNPTRQLLVIRLWPLVASVVKTNAYLEEISETWILYFFSTECYNVMNRV